MERRVVLLSRDAGLASTIDRLLSNGDRIVQFHTAAEVVGWSNPEVAAVVLDSQPNTRWLSYKQVRERYNGPVVMLLDRGERQPDLPPDGACRFLYRPFQVTELSRLLDTSMPVLGSLEAAIIAAWSRHAIAEPAPRPPLDLSYRVGGRRSSLRRARAWAATVVALMGLLLAFSLGDHGGSCASGCTTFGGAIAGAAESGTPAAAPNPGAGSAGGGSGGQPPGSSAASSEPPTPTGGTGFPVVTGIGGLIQSINPITSDDTTPPSGPEPVPGVPAPAGVSHPPATNPPPGTTPPPTSGPSTTAPATTATTAPPTTAPPTTAPPTTAPPTTAPPTTAETTAAPTTAAETTAAPTAT